MTTAQPRSKVRRAQQRRQAAARPNRTRRALVAAAVVVLAAGLGALVWWPAGGEPDAGQAGQSVEQFLHVHGLEITPWAPDEVYLATHQGLIRVDADGEWTSVSDQPHDFMGFSAHPSEEGVFYSSGHPAPGTRLRNPIGFMASTDGGVTWSTRSLEGAADFHAMTVAPSDGDVIYGWNGAGQAGLYVSTDGGSSWDPITDGLLSEVGGALSLAVHPEDPDEVWAGTQAGLLATRDAGRTWEPRLSGGVTAVAFDPADAERVLAYASGGGGLVESRDGGRTWTELGLVLDGDAAGHLAVHPEDADTLYVGTYGQGVLRTTDGGSSWETLAESGVPRRESRQMRQYRAAASRSSATSAVVNVRPPANSASAGTRTPKALMRSRLPTNRRRCTRHTLEPTTPSPRAGASDSARCPSVRPTDSRP